MLPTLRSRSVVATLAPWALLVAFAYMLSGCAFIGSALGMAWPSLVLAVTLALAACGSGSHRHHKHHGSETGEPGQDTSTTPSCRTLPAVFDLASLDGCTGFKLQGVNIGDVTGFDVSPVGDINGDGYPDFIVSAPYADAGGLNRGAVYVVFGHSSGFSWPAVLDLSTLDGTNGFQLLGANDYDEAGRSVSALGDVNGDGVDDFSVGSFGATPAGSLRATGYVVFGRPSGTPWPASLRLDTLGGISGFELRGVYEAAGAPVSGAGDVNGDGIPDIMISAALASGGGTKRGAVYVVFGHSSGSSWPAFLNLNTVSGPALDGTNGFTLLGANDKDYLGGSVSAAGDINGDGYPDLIIGAAGVDAGGTNRGAAYVVFGHSSGFSWPAIIVASTLDGTNGFQLAGVNNNDSAGRSVSGTGDINGDGYPDLIIGAPGVDAGGNNLGAAYVVFGHSSGFSWPATLALSTLDGSNGFQLVGVNNFDGTGSPVSAAGDINGDGHPDLVIGARNADVGALNAGVAYVVFGTSSGFSWPAALALSTLDGTIGFELVGTDDSGQAGYSARAAGDLDGDGVPDLLIGAPGALDINGYGVGAAYVVFGTRK